MPGALKGNLTSLTWPCLDATVLTTGNEPKTTDTGLTKDVEYVSCWACTWGMHFNERSAHFTIQRCSGEDWCSRSTIHTDIYQWALLSIEILHTKVFETPVSSAAFKASANRASVTWTDALNMLMKSVVFFVDQSVAHQKLEHPVLSLLPKHHY